MSRKKSNVIERLKAAAIIRERNSQKQKAKAVAKVIAPGHMRKATTAFQLAMIRGGSR